MTWAGSWLLTTNADLRIKAVQAYSLTSGRHLPSANSEHVHIRILHCAVMGLLCYSVLLALSNSNQMVCRLSSRRLSFKDGVVIFGVSPNNWPPAQPTTDAHKGPQRWVTRSSQQFSPLSLCPLNWLIAGNSSWLSACVCILCGILSFCLMPSQLTFTAPVYH